MERRDVASAPSASRSPATPASASASAQPGSQPAADVTAITTRDDFLLELGQTLGGHAAVRPVESLSAALESLAQGKRAQVLVIDAREVPDVRAAVDAAHAAAPRAVVLVFAEGTTEKHLGAALRGSKVFAVLPTPIDARKTQAVLEGAIAEALANRSVARAAAAPAAEISIGSFRPQPAHAGDGGTDEPRKAPVALLAAAAAALALIGGGFWFFTHGKNGPAPPAAPAAAPATAAPATDNAAPPVAAAETSLVQGKVDELLEKARLAMHERRFTEPAGDNALLYYRSAVAADAASDEAKDGLQRVAGVLAGRFEDAMNGARFEEAALTLANFKTATPSDPRVATFGQHLYAAEISKALADGNLDRAAALVRQAQQAAVPAEQLAKWRADIARRQEDAKVQHLAGLAEERMRDGKLADGDDSASGYLQQLQAAAPANPNTQRVAHELIAAYLHKAREAALAKNSAEQDRWLSDARATGARPSDIAAFQRDLASARQKAAQAESERVLQLVRTALRDGRLTEPAQDNAAAYLTQLQTSDPANAGLADAGRDLAGKLLARARAAIAGGKAGDADLAQAKHWGADPKEILAVQQAQNAAAQLSPAALAASLKRLRAPPPEYPDRALSQRVSGSVMLQFTVDVNGEPRDIHVVEATPPGVFDRAAISALKRWRYAPALVNGAPVEVPMKTLVRFELPK
jgi:TonB family protein